jgi:hypothetical protein
LPRSGDEVWRLAAVQHHQQPVVLVILDAPLPSCEDAGVAEMTQREPSAACPCTSSIGVTRICAVGTEMPITHGKQDEAGGVSC